MLGNNPFSDLPFSTLSASQSVTGTLSATLDSVSVAATASIGHPGTLAVTLDSISVAASATVGHTATLAATLGSIDVLINATGGQLATMAVTLDSINVSMSGSIGRTGTMAVTLDSISVDINATENKIYVVDTHDGEYYKKKFAKESQDKAKYRQRVVDLYEELVELKPKAAIDAVAPFIENDVNSQNSIDFNALLADLNRTEAVYNSLKRELEEIDDEDVLLLL